MQLEVERSKRFRALESSRISLAKSNMSQTPGGPQGAQTQLARYYLTNVGRKTYLEGRSGAYSQYAEGGFEKKVRKSDKLAT